MARKKKRRELREVHPTGIVMVLKYDEAPAPYKDLRVRRRQIQKAFQHRVPLADPKRMSEVVTEISHIYGPNSPEGNPWILDLNIFLEEIQVTSDSVLQNTSSTFGIPKEQI